LHRSFWTHLDQRSKEKEHDPYDIGECPAELTLESLIWWLIIGLIAGFLASVVMRSGIGYGIVGDIVAGLIGAFIGAALRRAWHQHGNGFAWEYHYSFVGACILSASSD